MLDIYIKFKESAFALSHFCGWFAERRKKLKKKLNSYTEKLYQKEIERLQSENHRLKKELDSLRGYYEEYKSLADRMKQNIRIYEKNVNDLNEIKSEYETFLKKCKNNIGKTS